MARIVEVTYRVALSDYLRFFAKVKEGPDECWLWTGSTTEVEPGRFYGYMFYNGRLIPAHRAAYDMFIGRILDGYVVDHLCGNGLCVNPDHLEAVTESENCRRGLRWTKAKRDAARQTFCQRGHAMSGLNLYIWRDSNGREHRTCKACAALRKRRYQQMSGLRPADGETRPGPLAPDAEWEVLSEFCQSQMPPQPPLFGDHGSVELFPADSGDVSDSGDSAPRPSGEPPQDEHAFGPVRQKSVSSDFGLRSSD